MHNVPSVSAPVELDTIDRRIIELLQDDGRRTVADIAARVNLSPAPVKRRIDRLERTGVIAGYTAVLDHARLRTTIEAFVEIRMSGSADVDAIITGISGIPEVSEIFTLAGEPDALIRIRVDDVEHLKRVVNEMRRGGYVTATKSLIVLGRWNRIRDGRRSR